MGLCEDMQDIRLAPEALSLFGLELLTYLQYQGLKFVTAIHAGMVCPREAGGGLQRDCGTAKARLFYGTRGVVHQTIETAPVLGDPITSIRATHVSS